MSHDESVVERVLNVDTHCDGWVDLGQLLDDEVTHHERGVSTAILSRNLNAKQLVKHKHVPVMNRESTSSAR